MTKLITTLLFLLAVADLFVFGCLITNCPRGGKRSKVTINDSQIKPCVSCGPGRSGQCFGPNICCGPFGCLMATPETARCQRDGFFHEREPCVAGGAPCRRNTGRCAAEGVCCGQDSCHADKSCGGEDKPRGFAEPPLDLYNLINYQAELSNES